MLENALIGIGFKLGQMKERLNMSTLMTSWQVWSRVVRQEALKGHLMSNLSLKFGVETLIIVLESSSSVCALIAMVASRRCISLHGRQGTFSKPMLTISPFGIS